MGRKTKRETVAVAVSIAVHGAIFLALALNSRSQRDGAHERAIVDMEFIERPRQTMPPPSPTAVEPVSTALPPPPPEKPTRVRREAGPPPEPSVAVAASSPVDGEGAVSENPSDGRATDATQGGSAQGGQPAESSRGEALPSVPVPENLSFSDIERLTENREGARADRERAQRNALNRRRNRGAFVSDARSVRAAMASRRSVAIGKKKVPLGENRGAAEEYLRAIHRKIGPLFSQYLTSLDSLSEQLHKRVQNSPMKYNPFYVPPPESERQDTLRGPVADLSMKTETEFEILPSGAIGDIRMLRSSTDQGFDAAAIDTVLKGAPFRPPPPGLLSLNDRTYVQWTFHRDWKKNSPSKGRLLLIEQGNGDRGIVMGPVADTDRESDAASTESP